MEVQGYLTSLSREEFLTSVTSLVTLKTLYNPLSATVSLAGSAARKIPM